jgi:serine/threonine-protein kinase
MPPARAKGEPVRANPERASRTDLGARTAVPELHTGRRAGLVLADRYRLLRRLGRSEVGRTWAGRQGDRAVVVRLFERSKRHAVLRPNAQRTIDAAARLDGFVRVLEVDAASDLPFVVTERVPGHSLGALFGDGPLPPARVAAILAHAARALDALHAAGAAHGALRTSSLLVDAKDRVRIDDLADPERDDATGFGDAPYRSPEQLSGRPTKPADDVWALSVIAYEALTGTLPFVAATPGEIIARAAANAFEPPTFVRPELPKALNPVLLRALSDDPAQRYESAGELADALVEATLEPGRWRRTALFIGLGALGLAGAVGLVAALLPPDHAPRARAWVAGASATIATSARREVVRRAVEPSP